MLLRDLPPYTRARIVRLLVPEDLPPGLRSELGLPWCVGLNRSEDGYDAPPHLVLQVLCGEGDVLVRTENWQILPELSHGAQEIPAGWRGVIRGGGRIYWETSSRSYDPLDWTEIEILTAESDEP